MKYFSCLLLCLCFLLAGGCSGNDENIQPEFTLNQRPASEDLLFDYTGTFRNIEESTRRYLNTLMEAYGIEACIVTLPLSPNGESIQQLAATLFTNWNIGRDFGSRGLLFLFLEQDKQVKLEVGYELEDVFTDAFTGYIEDLQLRPNYRAGDLEIGIIAVFEEVEKRAEIKKIGGYTTDTIDAADAELLSGGGGAGKKLSAYEEPSSSQKTGPENFLPSTGTHAATPGQAFEIMLGKWSGSSKYPGINIYTEATTMAMGDQNNPDDKRVSSQARLLLDVPYEVRQHRNVALIHFNRDEGWQYAPYLFVNDGSGWKFDIVSQRKYVVFGSRDSWHLERGDHPYNNLFSGFQNSLRKDLPTAEDVVYDLGDDQNIAHTIRKLERLASQKRSLSDTLELGRLGVVTARRPQHVYRYLTDVKSRSPDLADTYKYLAVYHVMSNFQYESALQEIRKYNSLTKNGFGLNLEGFLEYKLGNYSRAAEAFRESLQTEPTLYGWCKLTRAEAMLFLKTSKLDPRRSGHRQKAIDAYVAAREMAPGNWRVTMLERWLHHKNILPD